MERKTDACCYFTKCVIADNFAMGNKWQFETKEVIKNQSVVVRVAYCIDFTDRARFLLLKFAKNFGFNNGVLS